MVTLTHSFRLGTFDCLIIADGGGPRTAASFLSDIPQDELERVARQRNLDANALDFSRNILLVKTGSHTVLIDTGQGPGVGNLYETLVAQGIEPGAIDLVVITHAHFDHIGGILSAEGSFHYPNARYAIGKTEWDFYTDEAKLTAESPSTPIWRAVQAQDRVTLLDVNSDEVEIVPGICAVPAPGHTVGQIAPLIESDGDRLLHMADAAHTYLQLAHPEWSPKFDYDKVQAAQTRLALFERAARENVQVLAYHLPFPGLGRIQQRDDGEFTWQPVEG